MDISKALNIEGWMAPDELVWLAEQAQKYNLIAEFGSYKGRSTRALADNSPGIIFAIDPWYGFYFSNDGKNKLFSCDVFDQFSKNLKNHIDTYKVIPIKSKSSNFHGYANMIFIDGDHKYDAVVEDIQTAKSCISRHGLICGHDYGRSDWPGVKQAVDEIFGDRIQVHNTIWSVNAD